MKKAICSACGKDVTGSRRFVNFNKVLCPECFEKEYPSDVWDRRGPLWLGKRGLSISESELINAIEKVCDRKTQDAIRKEVAVALSGAYHEEG